MKNYWEFEVFRVFQAKPLFQEVDDMRNACRTVGLPESESGQLPSEMTPRAALFMGMMINQWMVAVVFRYFRHNMTHHDTTIFCC